MEIREAVEADAERMGDIADSPPDVMRNLVHDRTVRVAQETRPAGGSPDERTARGVSDGEAPDAIEREAERPVNQGEATREQDDDGDAGDGDEIRGLVSFDARDTTVHVTQLAGTAAACATLIEEPVRFARREGMDVELLVAETDDEAREAVEDAGFQPSGSGPRFEGEQTTRYRLEPGKAEQ